MRRLVLTGFALLTAASSSLAQGHMGTPQEQQACTRDAQRLSRKQLGDDRRNRTAFNSPRRGRRRQRALQCGSIEALRPP
jgi:hypothetical protein